VSTVVNVAFGVASLATLVYLYTFFRFYRIVSAEQAAWVARRGSLSFMYSGLPRAMDPNIGVALLGVAFSSRVSQLRSPHAKTYAFCIRLCLPLGCLLYLGILLAQAVGAV